MKFTLSWLKEHLDTDADAKTIADTLTRIGLEVEGIEDKGAALKAFTVAHVVSAEKHPNADKLKLCMVDTGDDIVQVVCGAPNAHTGMKAVFAKPGTVIPASGEALKARPFAASNRAACCARCASCSCPMNMTGSSSCPPTRPLAPPLPPHSTSTIR